MSSPGGSLVAGGERAAAARPLVALAGCPEAQGGLAVRLRAARGVLCLRLPECELPVGVAADKGKQKQGRGAAQAACWDREKASPRGAPRSPTPRPLPSGA